MRPEPLLKPYRHLNKNPGNCPGAEDRPETRPSGIRNVCQGLGCRGEIARQRDETRTDHTSADSSTSREETGRASMST